MKAEHGGGKQPSMLGMEICGGVPADASDITNHSQLKLHDGMSTTKNQPIKEARLSGKKSGENRIVGRVVGEEDRVEENSLGLSTGAAGDGMDVCGDYGCKCSHGM